MFARDFAIAQGKMDAPNQDVPILELTDEEVALVLAHREKQAAIAVSRQRVANMLRTAADYYDWLTEHRAGDTYTTFCDDFGYEAKDGEDRTGVHRDVMALIGVARLATQQHRDVADFIFDDS